jgi:hypothetical protein
MRKFATAIAAVGLVAVASSPAFANRQGGPDTLNAVAHEGVAVTGAQVSVWGGRGVQIQPTVSADAVTGTSSDDVTSYVANGGRGTVIYRVVRLQQPGGTGTQFAKDQYVLFVNG